MANLLLQSHNKIKNWSTNTAYQVGDIVTQSGYPVYCNTAHTSGTFATDSAAGNWKMATPMKNHLINGNMDVSQRGTSFSAGNAYKTDRWWIQNNAGSTQAQIATDLPNSTFNLRFTITNATNSGYVTQSIENINLVPIQGKTVTFSCWLRASSPATFQVKITKSTTSNINYSTGTWIPVNVTSASVTSTWQKFIVTATVPNDGTANGLICSVEPTNNLTNGSTWDVTQCMLNEGSIAAPFSLAAGAGGFAGELALCQRYYEKSYPQSAAPGSASTGVGVVVGYGAGAASVIIGAATTYKVTKRIVPTFTFYDMTGASNKATALGTGGTQTDGITANASGTSDSSNYVRLFSASVYASVLYNFTADAELN